MKKICLVDGCSRISVSLEMCSKHYLRHFRHGDVNYKSRRDTTGMTMLERFAHYTHRIPNGCWEWTGPQDGKGYGRLNAGNKRHLAHRYSYELYLGPIEKDYLVCHKCDNPLCVNPEHLFIGTHQDNMTDMVNKQRNTRGQDKHNAKLTSEDVIIIRKLLAAGAYQRVIAERFGVERKCISDIKTGRNWGWL